MQFVKKLLLIAFAAYTPGASGVFQNHLIRLWQQYAQDKTIEELIPENYDIEEGKKNLLKTYKEKQDMRGLCHGLAKFYLFDEGKDPTKRFLYQAFNLLEQSLHRTLEKQEKNFMNRVFMNIFILQEDQANTIDSQQMCHIPSLEINSPLDLGLADEDAGHTIDRQTAEDMQDDIIGRMIADHKRMMEETDRRMKEQCFENKIMTKHGFLKRYTVKTLDSKTPPIQGENHPMVKPVAALSTLNFDTLLEELTSVIEESRDFKMFSFIFNINGKIMSHATGILKRKDGSYLFYDPNGCPKVLTNPAEDLITILKDYFEIFIKEECSQDPAEDIGYKNRILQISLRELIFSNEDIHPTWSLGTSDVSSFTSRKMLPGEMITLKDAQDVQKVIGYVQKINQEECLLSLKDSDEGLYLLPIKDITFVLEERFKHLIVEPHTQLKSLDQDDFYLYDVSMRRLDLLNHETIFTNFWKTKEECQNVPLGIKQFNLLTMGAVGEDFVEGRKLFQDFLFSAEGQSEKVPEKRGLWSVFKEFMISCALTQEAFSHQGNEKTKGRLRMNHFKDITTLQNKCVYFLGLKENPPQSSPSLWNRLAHWVSPFVDKVVSSSFTPERIKNFLAQKRDEEKMQKQDKEDKLWEKIAFASFSQNQKESASLLTQDQIHSALSRISQFDAIDHYKKTHEHFRSFFPKRSCYEGG